VNFDPSPKTFDLAAPTALETVRAAAGAKP
jgi:hypothetical protein